MGEERVHRGVWLPSVERSGEDRSVVRWSAPSSREDLARELKERWRLGRYLCVGDAALRRGISGLDGAEEGEDAMEETVGVSGAVKSYTCGRYRRCDTEACKAAGATARRRGGGQESRDAACGALACGSRGYAGCCRYSAIVLKYSSMAP